MGSAFYFTFAKKYTKFETKSPKSVLNSESYYKNIQHDTSFKCGLIVHIGELPRFKNNRVTVTSGPTCLCHYFRY
jgi:hypothetical protein